MLKVTITEGALAVDGRQRVRVGLDAVARALDTSGHGRHHIAATLLREQAGMPEPDRGERVSEAEIAEVLRAEERWEMGGSSERFLAAVAMRKAAPRLAREVATLRADVERLREKARAVFAEIDHTGRVDADVFRALRAEVDPPAPEPTPEQNFEALKKGWPALAGVHERAAAKHGIKPWDVTNEQLEEECPALRMGQP